MTLIRVLLCLFVITSLGLAGSTQSQDCPQPNAILSADNLRKILFSHAVKCNPPRDIANANKHSPVKDLYDHGDVVTYSCKTDFTLNGTSSLKCEADGTFHPDPPTCITVTSVSCPSPHPDRKLDIEGNPQPPYLHGARLEFDCSDGALLVGATGVKCEMNSEWSPPLPECKDPNNITCPQPTAPMNMTLSDEYVGNTTFPYNSDIKFDCITGYVMKGGSRISTCTSAGTWTTVTLICKRKECSSLGHLISGTIHYISGTLFGDKAVLSCHLGYNLVGTNETTCGLDGWTNRLPVCEEVKCTPPAIVRNANKRPVKDVYNFGDVVTYRCKKDFIISGMSSLTCRSDGKFHPAPPSCIFTAVPDVPDPDYEETPWCHSWWLISLRTSSSLFIASLIAVFAFKYTMKKNWSFTICIARAFGRNIEREL